LEDEHTRDEVREMATYIMATYIMATSSTKLNTPNSFGSLVSLVLHLKMLLA